MLEAPFLITILVWVVAATWLCVCVNYYQSSVTFICLVVGDIAKYFPEDFAGLFRFVDSCLKTFHIPYNSVKLCNFHRWRVLLYVIIIIRAGHLRIFSSIT